MRNTQQFSLPDFVVLALSAVMLAAFFLIPWLNPAVSDYGLNTSGVRLLSAMQYADFEEDDTVAEPPFDLREAERAVKDVLFLIPLMAVLAGGAGLWGVRSAEKRHIASLLALAAGFGALLYYVIFVVRLTQAEADLSVLVGLGFWMALFAVVGLLLQVLLPRLLAISTTTGTFLRQRFSGNISQDAVMALTVLGLTLLVWLSNPRFLAERNVSDILANSSYIAVAAVGMTMVIISGNIDISVGSLIGVLATVAGQIAIDAEAGGYPVWIAFVVPVVLGAVAGAFNGFLVAYLRIPAIVVTLGMYSILRGGLILWTNGVWIYNLPPEFMLAQQRPLGVPVPIYFMIGLTILAVLWMRYSPWGRAIYAVGGNKEAARLSGISERSVIMMVFIINGVMVGIASVLFATQFNAIQSTVPPGLELLVITASVIGGVSILGGTGTVIGSTLGAILIHVIRFGMQFVDISQYWLGAVQGLLILLTVMVDLVRRRRQSYSGRG